MPLDKYTEGASLCFLEQLFITLFNLYSEFIEKIDTTDIIVKWLCFSRRRSSRKTSVSRWCVTWCTCALSLYFTGIHKSHRPMFMGSQHWATAHRLQRLRSHRGGYHWWGRLWMAGSDEEGDGRWASGKQTQWHHCHRAAAAPLQRRTCNRERHDSGSLH